MRKSPTWGQRQRLQVLGYTPADIGRMFNRSAPPPAPEKIPIPTSAAELEVMLGESRQSLQAGQLMHLPANMAHAVRAIEDTSALVTIVLCS